MAHTMLAEIEKDVDLSLANRIGREKPIIFWGYSDICEQLLELLIGIHDNLIVWDTEEAGRNTNSGQIPVEPFSIEDMSKDDIEAAIFVATFDLQQACSEALSILQQCGAICCYAPQDFWNAYLIAKPYADYLMYKKLNTDKEFEIIEENATIYAHEWYTSAGAALNDKYVVQDLWGARKVFEAKPEKHYDIGSSVSGFITHLLAFNMPTILIDVRPLETYGTENLTFIHSDATSLPGIDDNSIESLSALCSIEHFGLGRYGDPVDPGAHIKAFKSVQRVIKKGGNFYMSLPVSKTCSLEFNAHRIYAPQYVINHFDEMELVELSLCAPEGLVKNVPVELGELTGYGLFHFRKP